MLNNFGIPTNLSTQESIAQLLLRITPSKQTLSI